MAFASWWISSRFFVCWPLLNAFTTAAEQYLFTRATTIAGGTTEILKSLAGERVLGLPREPRP